MPENGFQPTPRGERNTWQNMLHTLKSGMGMVRRRPALWNILLIGLFFGLYSEGYDRLWVKHLTDNLLAPSGSPIDPVILVGLITAGGALLGVAATELVRRRLDTTRPNAIARMMMVASRCVGRRADQPFPRRSLVLGISTIWLIDVFRSLNSPLYTTWVNQRLEPPVRATVLSMSSQVDAVGQIGTGPALGMARHGLGTGCYHRLGFVTRSILDCLAEPCACRNSRLRNLETPAVDIGEKLVRLSRQRLMQTEHPSTLNFLTGFSRPVRLSPGDLAGWGHLQRLQVVF